jgi:hypothetical protein
MAKEKSPKTQPVSTERTFVCKFCGQAKPLSELTLQTRYFPVLAACLECDKTIQSLKIGNEPDEEKAPETTENDQE